MALQRWSTGLHWVVKNISMKIIRYGICCDNRLKNSAAANLNDNCGVFVWLERVLNA